MLTNNTNRAAFPSPDKTKARRREQKKNARHEWKIDFFIGLPDHHFHLPLGQHRGGGRARQVRRSVTGTQPQREAAAPRGRGGEGAPFTDSKQEEVVGGRQERSVQHAATRERASAMTRHQVCTRDPTSSTNPKTFSTGSMFAKALKPIS